MVQSAQADNAKALLRVELQHKPGANPALVCLHQLPSETQTTPETAQGQWMHQTIPVKPILAQNGKVHLGPLLLWSSY